MLPVSLQGHKITEGLQLKAAIRAWAYLWDNPWGTEQVCEDEIKPELGQGKDEKNKSCDWTLGLNSCVCKAGVADNIIPRGAPLLVGVK